MKIQHIHGLPPAVYQYLSHHHRRQGGILIDAAAAPETYLDALKAENATLTHILLTHGHYDHVGAVASVETGYRLHRLYGPGGRRRHPAAAVEIRAGGQELARQ